VVSSAYRCQPIFARRIMVDALTDAHDWDERYRTSELIWKAAPNQWVRQYTQDLSPGTALDLASGEGRNAIWLADRGWQVTAVDFSAVAMEKAKELASQHGNRTADRIEWVVEDVLSYASTAEYDLVLVIYLQVAAEQRKTLLQHAAAVVSPGGRLLVVGHHTDNLVHGVGGPPNPEVLYTEDDILADLAEFPNLIFRTAQRVERVIDGQLRRALDVVVEAERSSANAALKG
jgi:SAM-dependent methyltransferase